MLQKIYFMVFERYIPELKKYDSILFLHQPMTSREPLKIVQKHMAHPRRSGQLLHLLSPLTVKSTISEVV